MTWVWDASQRCWRGVSDATVTAWRAWAVGHPAWHHVAAHAGPAGIRCLKAAVLGLPMAIPGAALPYAAAPPPVVNVVPYSGMSNDTYFGPSGYSTPLGSAYGPGPVARGFIPAFGVPVAVNAQPVPGIYDQPVVPPSAIPPASQAPTAPGQPTPIPEPNASGVFGIALLGAILLRKTGKHHGPNAGHATPGQRTATGSGAAA